MNIHFTTGSAVCTEKATEDFVGFLDGIRRWSIIGWAFDRRHPKHRVSVLLTTNGELVSVVKANHYRPDLVDAGFGDGWSGFECPLPEGVTSVGFVEAVIEGSDCRLRSSAGDLAYEDRPLPVEWRRGCHFCKPSFFLLGAARSGTTSLHYYLDQHPDIFMSDPKEPFYFESDSEYSAGPPFYFNAYLATWTEQVHTVATPLRQLFLALASP